MIIAGVVTGCLSNFNNEYKQLLKMNQEAMAADFLRTYVECAYVEMVHLCPLV